MRYSLIEAIQNTTTTRMFPRDGVKIYTVNCSSLEEREVASLDNSEVRRLLQGIRKRIGPTGIADVPLVNLVCLGQQMDMELLPQELRSILHRRLGPAVWLRKWEMALVLLGGPVPFRRLALHELTHAWLDLVGGGFPYLIAIQEGLARSAEYSVPDASGVTEWSRIRAKGVDSRRHLNHEQFMSIHALLSFDGAAASRLNDRSGYLRMVRAAFWMFAFFQKWSKVHPKIRDLYSELRSKWLTAPDDVYRWIQESLNTDAEELEEDFRSYCMGPK